MFLKFSGETAKGNWNNELNELNEIIEINFANMNNTSVAIYFHSQIQ